MCRTYAKEGTILKDLLLLLKNKDCRCEEQTRNGETRKRETGVRGGEEMETYKRELGTDSTNKDSPLVNNMGGVLIIRTGLTAWDRPPPLPRVRFIPSSEEETGLVSRTAATIKPLNL